MLRASIWLACGLCGKFFGRRRTAVRMWVCVRRLAQDDIVRGRPLNRRNEPVEERPQPVTSLEPPPVRRPTARVSDRRNAALLALAALAACIAVNLPFLASYAVRGDTHALMLHSTRFFPADPGEWVREGFARYFVNFPEATLPYTGFVRPVVNATVWMESLLAARPDSPVFLLTNYLGHAACTGMVFLAARRLGGLGAWRATLGAVLFGGTVAALELLHSPAFRADMLAAGFGMAALLAVDGWLRGRGWALEGAVLLLLLALLSKETAVPAPFLAAGWALIAPGGRPRRSRVAAAAALLLPLVVFAWVRATGPQGVYVSLAGVRGVAQVASSAFFPGGGGLELVTVLSGRGQSAAEAARVLLAFALNVAGAVLLLRALLRRDQRAALLAAGAAATMAIPALLAPEPRMLYFGQMFALPLFAAVLPARRAAARPLAGLALLAGPLWLLASMAAAQPAEVADNRDSHELQGVLARELRDPRVRRVYLVSGRVGNYGSQALLRGAALRAGRPDVALRVVSSLRRIGNAPRRGTMELRRRGGELVVEERCNAAACDITFPGVPMGDEAKLGVPGVIAYPLVQPHRIVVSIPERGCDALLVGFTPAAPGVHVLRPCDSAWRRAAPQ
jgi:hypothetical protein